MLLVPSYNMLRLETTITLLSQVKHWKQCINVNIMFIQNIFRSISISWSL